MTEEIWEPHPVYPHEGSSLGRARTIKGRILAQRPNNRPEDAPPDQRYHLIDLWLPGSNGAKGKRITVSVHTFITECHWGLKKYRRQVARHVPQGQHLPGGPGGPADNRWVNLLGWGWPEDNEHDKPGEVRVAAARTARAAQLAARPRRRWWHRLVRHLPWSNAKPNSQRITAGSKAISKPVTNEAP